MARSGNGATPGKSTEQVAAELRRRLEEQLGRDRTEAIWRDPNSVPDVVQDEHEAASVAQIFLQAWKELPEEGAAEQPRRRSGFRRGLRLALIAAVGVWAMSFVKRARRSSDEDSV
ncbi:MAG: hypothetical protein IH958_05495 [Chloroflexi bacterium]|nr:hypothetical protein [Chloroflexota bacterium]